MLNVSRDIKWSFEDDEYGEFIEFTDGCGDWEKDMPVVVSECVRRGLRDVYRLPGRMRFIMGNKLQEDILRRCDKCF